jgi:hypothetical protein
VFAFVHHISKIKALLGVNSHRAHVKNELLRVLSFHFNSWLNITVKKWSSTAVSASYSWFFYISPQVSWTIVVEARLEALSE